MKSDHPRARTEIQNASHGERTGDIVFGVLASHANLETLEIAVPLDLSETPSPPTPLALPKLRYLRIGMVDADSVVQLMALLSFPLTTRIHLANPSPYCDPDFSELLPQEDDDKLRAIVGAIDSVHIEQPRVCTPEPPGNYYSVRCYVAGFERLRVDKYTVSPDGLISVFRDRAQVTHLVLSVEENGVPIDFRAFPQLKELDVSGPYVDYTLDLLQPVQSKRTKRPNNLICPSLARLVVRLRKTDIPKRTSTEFEDVALGSQCSALQEILAQRASPYKNRLSYLEINLPPPEEAECSHSITQSTLDSLRKLVDGPVVVKVGD